MKHYFKEYKSISNPQATKMLKAIEADPSLKGKFWRLEEKINGCNVQCLTDGDKIEWSSRSKVLIPGESFHNIWANTPKVEAKIVAIAKKLGKPISVVMEYYDSSAIVGPASIKYHNDDQKDFVAFDIKLVEEDVYLPYAQFVELCKEFELPYVGVYADGLTFEQAMSFEIEKLTSITAQRNGVEGTPIEGVVLKTHDNCDVHMEVENEDGSTEMTSIGRAIMKRICSAYTEGKVIKRVDEAKNAEERRNAMKEEIKPLLTEQRLFTKCSAAGIERKPENREKGIEALALDIVKELEYHESELDFVKQQCKLFVFKAFK